MAFLNRTDGLQHIDHHVGVLEIPTLPDSTILLVEVGRARVTGVTAAADLLPGARIRVVGYSEREAGLRVFTATELSVR